MMEGTYGMYKHEHTTPDEPCHPVFGQLTMEGVIQMKNIGTRLVASLLWFYA